MYKLLFFFVGPMLRFWFRVCLRGRVTGLENIPPGGAVIAPNHQSFWDIPLIAVSVPRRVHFMAKEELFRVPVFGALIRSLLAFPVRRGAPDRTAIRYAVERLQEGDLVVIFPEGTRSKSGRLGKFESGAAMIALKAGVPMVPAGICGTDRIFRNGSLLPPVALRFAPPVPTGGTGSDGRRPLEEISQQVREAIEKILNGTP